MKKFNYSFHQNIVFLYSIMPCYLSCVSQNCLYCEVLGNQLPPYLFDFILTCSTPFLLYKHNDYKHTEAEIS